MNESYVHNLDWSLIPSFLAVFDGGSLSAAARRLALQQPTVGRHIVALELQLGGELFERSRQGLRPTALAQRVEGSARAMAQHAAQLSLRAAQNGSADQGRVRVSVSEVVAVWLMPEVLFELRARYPGIAVDVVGSDRQDNLLLREADIALRMTQPTDSGLVAKKLAEVPIIAAAGVDYLKQCGGGDWRTHPWIGFDRKTAIVAGMRRGGMPIAPDDFALRTDHEPTYVRMIEAGLGVGFIAAYVAAQLRGVRQVFPEISAPRLPVWLVAHREACDVPVMRTVFDALAQAVPAALAKDQVPLFKPPKTKRRAR